MTTAARRKPRREQAPLFAPPPAPANDASHGPARPHDEHRLAVIDLPPPDPSIRKASGIYELNLGITMVAWLCPECHASRTARHRDGRAHENAERAIRSHVRGVRRETVYPRRTEAGGLGRDERDGALMPTGDFCMHVPNCNCGRPIVGACVTTFSGSVLGSSATTESPRRNAIPTESSPIPMRLVCPECKALHIDEGEFATKSHHTHACQECGNVWRPAVVATVGVRFLPGFKNEAAER